MRKFFRKISLGLGATLFFAACQEQTEDIKAPLQEEEVVTYEYEVIPGRYIVVLDESTENARLANVDYPTGQAIIKDVANDLLAQSNIQAEVNTVYSKLIKGFVADLDQQSLMMLANDDKVKYIEPDYEIIMQRPPWESGDDGSGSTGEEVPPGITRVNGGETYAGNNVAWILDTGVDLDHEDLNVDASRGFNAFTKGRDGKSLDDGNGHGTHVAGTIAAVDNEVGVVGVAAGATVVPVKVLDGNGSGSYSGVIAGIDHVGANGSAGDVANLSLGGPASQSVDDAVKAAASNGIRFCLAAGNDGDDANNYSPARVNGTNIFTISAMDASDVWAYFSNYGNPPVDYCAPGVNIKSTWKDGGYNTISGTSMATPHAAGVLLLGAASTDGTVISDPDQTADAIIVH